ncbi:hypothetical protein Anapl_06255 [Anas platyrhynchos]|uniref:Uncharacterized protein n=1 Tax=Anas platyrhynchos TaxID=8839 RepID=R0K2K6_ANAPL|nr:hypothetical protein Anapl_06255 [Anas platyrhynchos]
MSEEAKEKNAKPAHRKKKGKKQWLVTVHLYLRPMKVVFHLWEGGYGYPVRILLLLTVSLAPLCFVEVVVVEPAAFLHFWLPADSSRDGAAVSGPREAAPCQEGASSITFLVKVPIYLSNQERLLPQRVILGDTSYALLHWIVAQMLVYILAFVSLNETKVNKKLFGLFL